MMTNRTRRDFLTGAAGAGVTAALPGVAAGEIDSADDPDAELVQEVAAILERHRAVDRGDVSPPAGLTPDEKDAFLEREIEARFEQYERIRAIPAWTARGVLAKMELYAGVFRNEHDERRGRFYFADNGPEGTPDEGMLAAVLADLERVAGGPVV